MSLIMDIYSKGPAETNRIRAMWALAALRAFGLQTGQAVMLTGPMDALGEGVICEVAGDLLANLFHLARLNGVEPGAITSAARLHFDAEVQEEVGSE